MCSLHTPRNTQTTTYTMTNHRHQPSHLSMVPFWPDVIAVKDDHGAVCRLCHHIDLPALSSSHRTSWLLCVALYLLPYFLPLHSCPLVALAGCCMSRHICHSIVLPRPPVVSLRQLVVACCRPLSTNLVAPVATSTRALSVIGGDGQRP